MLTLALTRKWLIIQLDVSNAFIHDTLKEDVFIEQSLGYVDACFPYHVCKLHKALYGLKQAPRGWYDELCLALFR